MLEAPQITQTNAQPTAALHITIPRSRIREVLHPGLAEVRATVEAQGIAPNGPWFTHHHRIDPQIFDFDICVPVSGPITATGRVQPGEWPAMKVARTIYQGPFENLGAAWAEFDAWVKANGHAVAPDIWERYLVGPDLSIDPSGWRTELNHQLTL